MRGRTQFAAALTMWALAAALWPRMCAAAVGDLTPVAYRSDSVVDGGALFDCPEERFAGAKSDSGTISPKAVIAKPKYRDFEFQAAIDAKAKDVIDVLDCVRFDFSNRGQFADAPMMPMTALVSQPKPGSPEHNMRYAFGPAEVKIVRDGRTIPALVRGEYTERGSMRWIGVKIGTGLQGTCQFGANARWIIILDGTGNLVCGDVMGAKLIDGKLVIKPEDEASVLRVSNGSVSGDTILVDMAEPGSGRRRLVEQLYGQPMWVDGKWYQISVSPDHTKVSAKAVDLPWGRFKTEHSSWSTRLIGENGCFVAIGIAQPDGPAVPAGKYAIMNFHEYLRGQGAGGSIFCRTRDVIDGHPYIVEIAPGKTTMVKVGSPLTAELQAEQKDRTVTLTLKFTDADGGAVDVVQTGRAEGLANAPDVEIQDAQGKTMFTGKMTPGGPASYSLAWPVPEGAAGRLTATPKNLAGPCPISAKTISFEIK